ncbi:MAG: hypothetical protein K2X74_16180 [Acetobacteraceae bacterium]|nr:hypothetical protein [Acetobacteraceae bacterium]
MRDPAAPAPARLASALEAANSGPFGASLTAWEEALRAHVQQQMELAVLRLSQGAAAMLDPAGAKFAEVDVTLPLPAGERFRFRASLELVE